MPRATPYRLAKAVSFGVHSQPYYDTHDTLCRPSSRSYVKAKTAVLIIRT